MQNFMADIKIILVIHSPFPGGAINVYFLPLGQHLSILAETIETNRGDHFMSNDYTKLLHYNALNSLWLLLMI